MGADVSRVRFDPLSDFAGVVLQQGRLLLDADFNELRRAARPPPARGDVDLTRSARPGHAGVAWVPRQTPDGFRVTPSGGALTIGRGRCTSTGCSPRTTARAATASTRCSRSAPARPTRRTTSSRTGRRPTPLPTSGTAPRLPRRLAARGHAPRGSGPRRDRGRRRHDRAHADRVAGAAARRTPATRPARPTTTRSRGWTDVIAPVGRPADDRHRRRRAPTTIRASCRRPAATAASRTRPTASRSTTGGAPGHGDVQVVARQRLGRDPRRRDGLDDRAAARVASARTTCCGSRPATGSRSSTTTTSSGSKPGEMRKVTVDDAARTITFTGALPADLQPANAADAAARHLRVRRWDQSGVVKERRRQRALDLDAAGSG